MTSRWVVRTCKVVELITREIPKMLADMELSQYSNSRVQTVLDASTSGVALIDSTVDEGQEGKHTMGWRTLLAERLSVVRPQTSMESYRRRINGIMNQDYMLFNADIADALCISLGLNIEDELVTYPKHKDACAERVLIEWELAGVPITKPQLDRIVEQRFVKYQREMYPNGKVTTAQQIRDRQYRAAKKARAAEKRAA